MRRPANSIQLPMKRTPSPSMPSRPSWPLVLLVLPVLAPVLLVLLATGSDGAVLAQPDRPTGDDLAEVGRAVRVLGSRRPGDGGRPAAHRGERPAGHGGQPRLELARTDRLGDVVVGPRVEAGEHVVLLRAAADDHDVGPDRLASDPAGDLEAVHLRHRHVDRRQDRAVLDCQGDAVRTVRRRDDREAGLGQHDLQEVDGVLVVVDHEGDGLGVHRDFRHAMEYHRGPGSPSGVDGRFHAVHGGGGGQAPFGRGSRSDQRMPVQISMTRPASAEQARDEDRRPGRRPRCCRSRAAARSAPGPRSRPSASGAAQVTSRFPEPGEKR